MVWVITGTVNGSDDNAENEYPPESSHYLRPDREYKLGRMSYTTIDPKTGKSLTNKARLVDFALKVGAIPKDGLWTISTGSWTNTDAIDDPNSPTNLEPYSLKIISSRVMYRNPGPDGSETLAPNVSHDLRHGDSVTFLKGKFSVSWVPIILCFASGTAQAKAGHLQRAQSLGIKVAYRTFLPHHTHLLTKSLGPSFQLLLAAMRGANICSPIFFEDLSLVGKLDARPAACPPIPPGTGPVDAATEKAILKVHPTAGYDVRRHWGHAFLEEDWGALKSPTDPAYACEVNPDEPAVDTLAWNRNERRKSLFKDILFVSFRGEDGNAVVEEEIITLGGGAYWACELLRPNVQARILVTALDEHKREKGLADDVRIVIFPPVTDVEDPDPALRAFADAVGVSTYVDDAVFGKSIAEVDETVLFGPPLDPTQANSGRGGLFVPATAIQSSAAPTPSPAATFKDIPGTHPEEDTLAPRSRASRAAAQQGGIEAGPSGANREPAAEEPAPVVRKLTRRTKTTPGTAMQSLFNVVPTATEPDSRQPHTQLDRPSQSQSTGDSQMDYDDISYIAPVVRNLKRRGGPSQQNGTAGSSLFDFTPESTQHAAKKARLDEDADAAQATQLSVVAEDEEAPTPGPSTTRKRHNDSQTIGSDADEAGATATAARKKRRATSEVPEEVPTSAAAAAKGKKSAPTPVKVKKGAAGKKGAKDKPQEAEDDGLLRMKALPPKRKGAALDQGFNDDFNALKIVRPTLQPMKVNKGRRLGWNENDKDEELERLIRQDMEREENPEEWGGQTKEQGMFVVEFVSMARKNRPAPRESEVDGRYAGRPNFKKFRSKNSDAPAAPRKVREPMKYTVAEPSDFGLGAAYNENPKPAARRQAAAEDDDDEFDNTQPKLTFSKAKAKPAASKGKAKGKSKALVVDSDDSDASDVKAAIAMDVDSDDDERSQTLTTTKKPAVPSAKKPAPIKKAPPRKTAPQTLIIDDDSDDSDGGLTFKGFGKKRKR